MSKNSPLKYFGGKNGMANRILEYFPVNYQKMVYLEPFCGSAAMLFKKDKSPIEIINDLDHNIYSFFKTLIEPELFKEFKSKCDLSLFSEEMMKEYTKSLKEDELSISERAYKFFYCNRVRYNGSGGFSTTSVIRRGMSKSISDFLSTVDGLSEIHNRLSTVAIHNTDAIGLIEKWDKTDVFIYCDSPYANETRTGGRYKHDMTDSDQDRYLETLLGIKNAKILLSGYACERYSTLENNGWKRVDLEINTQNTNREAKTKVESLWMNYEK